ncbi:hypothetical protein Hanom_Chr01g00007751 [Helianthus anomalus]
MFKAINLTPHPHQGHQHRQSKVSKSNQTHQKGSTQEGCCLAQTAARSLRCSFARPLEPWPLGSTWLQPPRQPSMTMHPSSTSMHSRQK